MKIVIASAVVVGLLVPVPPGPGAVEGDEVLGVEQVFRDQVEGPARIEFRVGAVSLMGPLILEEATDRPRVEAADGTFSVNRLRVVLAEGVEARLNDLGIEDLQTHFSGKSVRVAGDLKREALASSDGNTLITYSLTIDRLDQLEAVTRPTTPAPGSGR